MAGWPHKEKPMKLSDMMDTSKDHFNWYIETILKGEKI